MYGARGVGMLSRASGPGHRFLPSSSRPSNRSAVLYTFEYDTRSSLCYLNDAPASSPGREPFPLCHLVVDWPWRNGDSPRFYCLVRLLSGIGTATREMGQLVMEVRLVVARVVGLLHDEWSSLGASVGLGEYRGGVGSDRTANGHEEAGEVQVSGKATNVPPRKLTQTWRQTRPCTGQASA